MDTQLLVVDVYKSFSVYDIYMLFYFYIYGI